MASKLDYTVISLNGSFELPLEPTPRAEEGASDDEFHPSLSTEATQWKFKHGLVSNDIMIKNGLDQVVHEVKMKGIVHAELHLVDVEGRHVSTLKVPAMGGKAKIFFEKNVQYAMVKATGILKNHWTITTTENGSEEIKVKGTGAFNTNFEFTRHGQVILSSKAKFRTSKIEIASGEDVPLLLICAAYVDLRLRGQI